jgi:hypothetical protein
MDLHVASNTPFLSAVEDNNNWISNIYSICIYMSLPLVMMLSSIGNLLIKTGESSDNFIIYYQV